MRRPFRALQARRAEDVQRRVHGSTLANARRTNTACEVINGLPYAMDWGLLYYYHYYQN